MSNQTKSKKNETEELAEVVNAVKGFELNMQCRGYQFKVGETFEHDGAVKACEGGFHSIEGNPLEVFDYYAPGLSTYCEVEASGTISRHDGDSKIASARLHVKAVLSWPDFVGRAIAWITAQCEPANAKHSEGDQSASSATGLPVRIERHGRPVRIERHGRPVRIERHGQGRSSSQYRISRSGACR